MDPGRTGAASRPRSPAIRRTSSHRPLQFSQKLKARAMSRAKQFSQDLTKRFTRTQSRANLVADVDEPLSAAELALAARSERRQRAIRGLRVISGSSKASSNPWIEVQRSFDRLARDGYLSRADFPQCIGMAESREFAMELFDALSLRRQIQVDRISKDELREIWQQITDNSSDARLQVIFHMSPFWYDLIRVDEDDADGHTTEEEVKEVESMLETYGKMKPGSACQYVTSSRSQVYQNT